MAHFIADRLDYNNSDIFVTPFGGMCRVLLNKPRHLTECYNDYSSGLVALMSILSNPDTATEFIHRLEDETCYSREVFDYYKNIYDSAEKDLDEQEEEEIKQLLIKYNVCTTHGAKKLTEYILSEVHELGELVKTESRIPAGYDKFKSILKNDDNFRREFQEHLEMWVAISRQKEEDGYLAHPRDMGLSLTDMDLAMATYVVYAQSRDGMGRAWSEQKFKTNAQYTQQLVRLFDCAERLEGVTVSQIDAMCYFIDLASGNVDETKPGASTMSGWLREPRVMMYCDPSYISPESERKLLAGIDVEAVNSLSEAIKEKKEKMPQNLGSTYAYSFEYDMQEKFVKSIQDAKCKMLVSNYDLVLYNKYLNEDTGWRKEVFQTTTGAGGKKDNKRTEVIWYNY